MTSTQTPSSRIVEEATSWPGVQTRPGSRGELSIRLGSREIGHLHGDRAAHFGFPRAIWEQLMEAGRVERHPIDHPGWAARRIRDEADVDEVIALLRLNYDRAVARHGVPAQA